MPAAAPVLRDERAVAVEDVVEVVCVAEAVELVGLADEVLAATVCWSSACGAGAWNVSLVGSEHVLIVPVADPYAPQHAHKLLVAL